MSDIIDMCVPLVARMSRPTVPEVRAIIDVWYARPENGAGGELHCELDDGNLEDRFLLGNLVDNWRVSSQDARWISLVLLRLTRSQRRRL